MLGLLPTMVSAAQTISYMQFLPGGQTCTVNLYSGVIYGSPSIVPQPLTTCYNYVKINPATNVATTFSHCTTTAYSVRSIVPGAPDASKAVLIGSWMINVPQAYMPGDGLLEQVNWKMGYGVSADCSGSVS